MSLCVECDHDYADAAPLVGDPESHRLAAGTVLACAAGVAVRVHAAADSPILVFRATERSTWQAEAVE